MARASKVVLGHIAIPGNHSISFTSNSARDAWFDGRDKHEFPNLSYVRQEGIQIESVLDNVRPYNFGYYKNESGDRIYFRITNMQYLNENNTLLEIEKDVLLTYLPTSVMQPSYIERSNDQPSSIFDADVPEIVYGGGTQLTKLGDMKTTGFSFFLQLSGDHEPDSQKYFLTNVTTVDFNGNTHPISFASAFVFENGPGFVATLQDYATAGTGDRIVSAGFIAADDYTVTVSDAPASKEVTVTCIRNTASFSVSSSLNTRVAKDNVTVIIAEIDNFANQIEIPLAELSGGSITLVSVSDPISQQRHYGVLSGADGDNELKYRITINTGGSLPVMNLPYYMSVRNIETDLMAQQTNLHTQALGGVEKQLVGAIANPVGSLKGLNDVVMDTAVNASQNMTSAGAAIEKSGRQAPTVSGNPTGFGVLANRAVGVNVFLKEPTGSGLQQLVDYYRFFGYNKCRILTPNVKTGTHFYVGNINGNFPGASATDISTIRSLFTSGVWIWDDEESFFSY